MINSDECCIIEELRGRAFNGKGGEEEERHGTCAASEKRRGRDVRKSRNNATVVRNALPFFRVFHRIIHSNS